jgi:type IX secretion system PorP/SprF family membrane protein
MTPLNITFIARIHFLMKRFFWLTYLPLLFISPSLKAQDQSNFNQFYLNPYLLNPSFVGIDGQTAFTLIYRKQWANIDGGPSIGNLSFQSPLTERLSAGLSITNDQKGLLNNTGLLLSVGIQVPLAEHSFLRFGLSAGGAWNMVDLAELDANDPAVTNLLENNASLNGNAGLSVHVKSFHLGVSMPSILAPSYVSTDAFTITEVKPFESLIVHASNRFYFNDNKNIFEPYAIYRMNTGLPSQFEVAGIVHLNHAIWAGGSYKQDFGISAMLGLKLQSMLAIGASYSLQNSGINQLNSPSYEISLSYLFGKRKKGIYAYSFVNTVKEKERKTPVKPPVKTPVVTAQKTPVLTPAQKAAHDREVEAKKAEAKKREDEIAKKRLEAQAKATAKKSPDSVKTAQHNPRFKSEMTETFKTPEELLHEQEQATLKRLEVHKENPTEHHGEDPDLNAHAERHEFVKKGDHAQELDVADYVIGGVFKADANAKHFAEGLIKLGFKAHYGHLTEKTLWYVYLIQTDDIDKARAERDRVRKMKILKDAWLLTVHH